MKNKWIVILCAVATAVAVSLSGCTGKDKNTDKGKDKNITGNKIVEREKNPVPQEYEEDACGEKTTWNYDESSGVLTVTGDGEMWDYIYKEDGRSFYDKADTPWKDYEFGTVVISEGVERIGDNAFYYCRDLYKVEMPDTVTSIGDSAFETCDYLHVVEFSDNITSIGEKAFKDCYYLQEINLPDSVVEIGDYAFISCDFQEIDIPDSVVRIGEGAFSSRSSFFKSVEIPASVEYIGHGAFSGQYLENINVDANNKKFSSVDGVLFNKDKTELVYYPHGKTAKEYIIPDGVLKIGNNAFEYDYTLESIVIPQGVTEIGDYAFNGPPLKSITIPDSVTKIGDSVFLGASFEEIVIPEGVKSMGDYVFAYSDAIKKVTLPESLESIGKRVFYSTSLEEIHFGGTKEQWEALGIQADTIEGVKVTFGK